MRLHPVIASTRQGARQPRKKQSGLDIFWIAAALCASQGRVEG